MIDYRRKGRKEKGEREIEEWRNGRAKSVPKPREAQRVFRPLKGLTIGEREKGDRRREKWARKDAPEASGGEIHISERISNNYNIILQI